MEMKSLMTRVIFTSRRFLCGPWPLQPHFLIRRWIVQLASDKDHRTRGRHETGLVNAVAFLFFVDDRADIGDEVVVGGAFAKERAEVMIFPTEQAGAELAVGRDPDSRTRTAFTLAGAIREFCTASMPSITLENDLVRVMRSNLAGSSESRLMLMRRKPAARRRSHRSARRWPLVVMERSGKPRAWSRET